jgi:hypothetical protein
MSELDRLNAAHDRAWNEGRYADCTGIIQRIKQIRGIITAHVPHHSGLGECEEYEGEAAARGCDEFGFNLAATGE